MLNNAVKIEINCADIPRLLSALNKAGIVILSVEYIDELTVSMIVPIVDYSSVRTLCDKHGGTFKVKNQSGVLWNFRKFSKRPLLLILILLLLTLSLVVPRNVLFVRVDGSATVPENLIIETAAQCGLNFGASCKEVRSERIKNTLIEKIPQLEWVGVNTAGCVATISVKEKTLTQEKEDIKTDVSSIVAARDGVISELTVLNGNPVCNIGQAVKKDQLLISGYTDCGKVIQATHAKGDVYARTHHDLSVLIPAKSAGRDRVVQTQRKYGLKIGKKQINFYKDSGISGVGCVKMYKEHCLTLPGSFKLPIWFTCQTDFIYSNEFCVTDIQDASIWAKNYCATYLHDQMVDGEILIADYMLEDSADVGILHARYSCVEMIGMSKYEESLH